VIISEFEPTASLKAFKVYSKPMKIALAQRAGGLDV
jgi:hypothetical protein